MQNNSAKPHQAKNNEQVHEPKEAANQTKRALALGRSGVLNVSGALMCVFQGNVTISQEPVDNVGKKNNFQGLINVPRIFVRAAFSNENEGGKYLQKGKREKQQCLYTTTYMQNLREGQSC